MEPSKESKNANKHFNKEASAERNSSKVKKRQKKKLTDKLGAQWTKDELERFYEAYRKHGRDWNKVAAVVQNNRSVDMVEALFSMNRAYLSLPEGTASLAGFTALMTDHHSFVEEGESESEGEGHGASVVSRKHENRKHANVPPSDIREEVISPHSVASTEGCLSQLRLSQAYRIERRATGKRTLRSENQRDNITEKVINTPPNKRANIQLEADDDDASTRVGRSPDRRTDVKMLQAEESQPKHCASSIFENVVRISRDRDGAVEVPRKEKNVRFKHAEACNANERLISKPQKGFVDTEASRDELEALRALAELSASLTPAYLMELESSSAEWKEEKSKQVGQEDSLQHVTSAADNRKHKSAQKLVDGNAVSIEEHDNSRGKRKPSHNKEVAEDDNVKTLITARRASQGPAKQQNTAMTSKETSSTSDKNITGPDAVSVSEFAAETTKQA